MTKLTHAEATELLDIAFNVSGEDLHGGIIEATIADMTVPWAVGDVSSFLATLCREIDPDSITVKPDIIDDVDMDCVTITIHTEEN